MMKFHISIFLFRFDIVLDCILYSFGIYVILLCISYFHFSHIVPYRIITDEIMFMNGIEINLVVLQCITGRVRKGLLKAFGVNFRV